MVLAASVAECQAKPLPVILVSSHGTNLCPSYSTSNLLDFLKTRLLLFSFIGKANLQREQETEGKIFDPLIQSPSGHNS